MTDRVLILTFTFIAAVAVGIPCQTAAYAQGASHHAPAAKGRPQAPGHAHSGGSALQPAIDAYLNRLRPKLYANWLLPDGNNNVEITATLDEKGNTEQTQVTSNPKNGTAEQAAADAFSKAQPLESLPSGIDKAKLVLGFISKADPHGDSSSNITTRFEQVQVEKKAPAASGSSDH